MPALDNGNDSAQVRLQQPGRSCRKNQNKLLGKASTLALFAITLACLYGFGKYIRKRTTQQYSE